MVFDIKSGEFEPEYAGKMNYYLSAVDDQLKVTEDSSSIGVILCKSKTAIDVEYALRDMGKPMGISEFSFSELPDKMRKNLPSKNKLLQLSTFIGGIVAIMQSILWYHQYKDYKNAVYDYVAPIFNSIYFQPLVWMSFSFLIILILENLGKF